MIGIYISAAALAITILGATWKLSALIATLTQAFGSLQKAVDKLGTAVEAHTVSIVDHDGRIERTEKDVNDIRNKLDAA